MSGLAKIRRLEKKLRMYSGKYFEYMAKSLEDEQQYIESIEFENPNVDKLIVIIKQYAWTKE